jgi:arsenate reductase
MDNNKYTVLFVCVHNSARSQMAEAFLNELGKEKFEAESAGIEPGALNPNVVAAMAETGLDISGKQTKAAFDLVRQGKHYDAVITVCDAASAEKCPVFPGKTKRIAWSFSDPSRFTGTEEQVMAQTRQVRDAIRQKVEDFIGEAGSLKFWI